LPAENFMNDFPFVHKFYIVHSLEFSKKSSNSNFNLEIHNINSHPEESFEANSLDNKDLMKVWFLSLPGFCESFMKSEF